MVNLKKRVTDLETSKEKLESDLQEIIRDNLASVDEQTRKIFELTQSQHFEERNKKDEKIRKLEDQLDGAREGVTERIANLEHKCGDLNARKEHLEKEAEARLLFHEQQDKEQETERNQLLDKIKTLDSALVKLRSENRVSINDQIMARHHHHLMAPPPVKIISVDNNLKSINISRS